jgi:hypothetical protein
MTPEEYVNQCLLPSEPVGFQYCRVLEDALRQGWNEDQIRQARDLIMQRHEANAIIFPFPKRPRYV